MKAHSFATRRLLACLFIAILAAPAANSAPGELVTVTTDHTNAVYRRGEQVTFTIALPAGVTATNADLSWKISKDGFATVRAGAVTLTNGTMVVSGELNEPGFLLCQITGGMNGKEVLAQAGAAVDPLAIKPSLPPPADFDAFWAGQKRRLAAVPMNPRLTPVTNRAAPNLECFDVQLDCAGGAPVSGYYARPRGAAKKSLPLILLLHGAGVNSASLAGAAEWARQGRGMLAMDINAHGIANGQPAKFYEDLAQGRLANYWLAGRDSRENCYFLGMFLRALRALDFLAAQPEWDGTNAIVYGSSQGGFQCFAVAGLDERVSFIAAGVPAGCDHTGMKANRISGWPKLVSLGGDGAPDAAALEAARYFDCVNFAARARARGAFVTVGFIDHTCPPTSVYAAYNNLPIPKQIFNDLPTGHANSPAAIRARNAAVLASVTPGKTP
jgi:cephalosporin-C deacetylase-like acetyl esterase